MTDSFLFGVDVVSVWYIIDTRKEEVNGSKEKLPWKAL